MRWREGRRKGVVELVLWMGRWVRHPPLSTLTLTSFLEMSRLTRLRLLSVRYRYSLVLVLARVPGSVAMSPATGIFSVWRLRASGALPVLVLSIGANNNKLIISPLPVPYPLRHSSTSTHSICPCWSTSTHLITHSSPGTRQQGNDNMYGLSEPHLTVLVGNLVPFGKLLPSRRYFLNSLRSKRLLKLVTSTSCSRSHSSKQA